MLFKTLVLLLAGWVTAEFNIEIHKKYKELPFSEFVTYFNGLNRTWTITEYPKQHFMFGVKKGIEKLNLYRKVHHKATDVPENFDSREKWPHCNSIRTINDQGDCGSCWIFGSINTASDRTCIHKNINVQFSEAVGTCIANGTMCLGGLPLDGFSFWKKKGLVTKLCANYTVADAFDGKCKTECENPDIKYNDDKHFGERIYLVDRDSIREELVKNGPVEAGMGVYEDFENYKGGIYEHEYGDFLAMHSVRVIGYGRESGVDYWLIANSWGTSWGEEGFFRIKRFINIGIEDSVTTALPKK